MTPLTGRRYGNRGRSSSGNMGSDRLYEGFGRISRVFQIIFAVIFTVILLIILFDCPYLVNILLAVMSCAFCIAVVDAVLFVIAWIISGFVHGSDEGSIARLKANTQTALSVGFSIITILSCGAALFSLTFVRELDSVTISVVCVLFTIVLASLVLYPLFFFLVRMILPGAFQDIRLLEEKERSESIRASNRQ